MQRFNKSGRGRRRGHSVASLKYLPGEIPIAKTGRTTGFLFLEAPYNKEFLDSLKASVPQSKRVWDNNDKAWYVVRDQFDKLSHLLDMYYDETILVDFPAAQVSSTAWARLYLVENAPLEVVRAVFKVLAMKHHPDKGGDAGTMQVINDAYKEILGELKNGD